MYHVDIDESRNMVFISFEGDFTLEDGENLYIDIKRVMAKAKKGFGLLADLSSLNSMDANVQGSIGKGMDLMDRHGVSRVVRIIPDTSKDIGFKIMSLFHYSKGVKIHTCQSREEADKYFQ